MMMPKELQAPKIQKTVGQKVMLQYYEAYSKRDINQIAELFTKDAEIWGTAQDEHRKGIDEIVAQHLRDWSQSEKGGIEVVTWVSSSQDALWAAADCNARIVIQGKEYVFEHLRGSLNIIQEGDNWKICFMHASFPDMRSSLGESFPMQEIE